MSLEGVGKVKGPEVAAENEPGVSAKLLKRSDSQPSNEFSVEKHHESSSENVNSQDLQLLTGKKTTVNTEKLDKSKEFLSAFIIDSGGKAEAPKKVESSVPPEKITEVPVPKEAIKMLADLGLTMKEPPVKKADDFSPMLLDGKASKSDKNLLRTLVAETKLPPEVISKKIEAFNQIVDSSDLFSKSDSLRETTLRSVFSLPNKSSEVAKTIVETAKLFPDTKELKSILQTNSGDSLDTLKGKVLFTASVHLEAGLIDLANVKKLADNGVVAHADFLQTALTSVEHAIDTGNTERAKSMIKDLGAVEPATQLKIDFLNLKSDLNIEKTELRSEINNKNVPKQLKGASDTLSKISSEDILNRIDSMQMKITELNDLESKIPLGDSLTDKLRTFRTNILSDVFKSSVLYASQNGKDGAELIKNIKTFFTEGNNNPVSNLKKSLAFADRGADQLQGRLEVELQRNRSTGDRLKGFFSTSHDLSKAFRTVKESETQLKTLYDDFNKVSGAKGEIRSSFRQKLPFTRQANDAEKAVRIANKIQELESKMFSSLNVIAKEAKSASPEALQDLKKFIDFKNQSFNLRSEINIYTNFAKSNIDDVGSLARQITSIQKSRPESSIGHAKTNTGAYLEMKEKLAPLANMMPGQSIVVSTKGFAGVGSDLPAGGNYLLKAEGNIYVASEMNVKRLEDGRVLVTQNTRQGVEVGARAAMVTAGEAHLGAIQQREIIFPNLDTAIRELANTKGILPSDSEVEKAGGLEKGTSSRVFAKNKESSSFTVSTTRRDEHGNHVTEEKTRWIQNYSDIDKSALSKLGLRGMQVGTYVATTKAAEHLAEHLTEKLGEVPVLPGAMMLGYTSGLNYKINVSIEADKEKADGSTFKLREFGSKADLQFKFEDIIELKKMAPDERENEIKTKALVLANMFQRSLEDCSVGTEIDCKVLPEHLDKALNSIENSIRYILNNDSLIAKTVRETDSLTNNKATFSGGAEIAREAAKDALDVGLKVKSSKNNTFSISLPLTQKDGLLEIGTPKVGIRSDIDKKVAVEVGKIIPFVEIHAGKNSNNAKMNVMGVVKENEPSDAKFVKIPLVLGEKIKAALGKGGFEKPPEPVQSNILSGVDA